MRAHQWLDFAMQAVPQCAVIPASDSFNSVPSVRVVTIQTPDKCRICGSFECTYAMAQCIFSRDAIRRLSVIIHTLIESQERWSN